VAIKPPVRTLQYPQLLFVFPLVKSVAEPMLAYQTPSIPVETITSPLLKVFAVYHAEKFLSIVRLGSFNRVRRLDQTEHNFDERVAVFFKHHQADDNRKIYLLVSGWHKIFFAAIN